MKRELNVGETLGEVFSIYGANAGVLLPLAFWIFLVVAIVDGVASSSLALVLAGLVIGNVAGTLYRGMVVGLVRDVQEGRREPTFGDLFDSALPVFVPLIAAGLLAGLGILAGTVLFIVPGLVLLTIWSVIAPAIVVERKGVLEAFGRSRELVRGYGRPVFWVLIVAVLITVAVSVVLLQIAAGVADGPFVRIVFSALAVTATAPIEGLVSGVLYYRLLGFEKAAPAPVDVSPPAA